MSKRQPLVCQFLEGVSREVLAKHQDTVRDYIRNRQGVYALYRRTKLYYVGLAINLSRRLKQHLRDRHGDSWDRFSVYLTIGDDHIKELESLVLRIVQPKANRQSGRFSNAENLRRRFARDIRQKFRAEIADWFGAVDASQNGQIRKRVNRRGATLSYLTRGRRIRLRARLNGRTIRAGIRPDGKIRYARQLFRTPSAAAVKACGHNMNGWRFWEYERAPGDWVRLRELRRH